MKPRLLTADEVRFSITVLEEDMPIEGNILSSGDKKIDEEAERWVRDQLKAGNPFAWCLVTVRAYWGPFSARDTLGGVSYKDEAPTVYAADLRQREDAVDRLKLPHTLNVSDISVNHAMDAGLPLEMVRDIIYEQMMPAALAELNSQMLGAWDMIYDRLEDK